MVAITNKSKTIKFYCQNVYSMISRLAVASPSYTRMFTDKNKRPCNSKTGSFKSSR